MNSLKILRVDWEDDTMLVVDLSDGTLTIYGAEQLAERAPNRIATAHTSMDEAVLELRAVAKVEQKGRLRTGAVNSLE